MFKLSGRILTLLALIKYTTVAFITCSWLVKSETWLIWLKSFASARLSVSFSKHWTYMSNLTKKRCDSSVRHTFAAQIALTRRCRSVLSFQIILYQILHQCENFLLRPYQCHPSRLCVLIVPNYLNPLERPELWLSTSVEHGWPLNTSS